LQSVSVPWGKMFRSPAVWAIIVSHMGNNWGSYTILSCIPMYMKEVLKFDIKSVSIAPILFQKNLNPATLCQHSFVEF
jgi:sugar phosphate permease